MNQNILTYGLKVSQLKQDYFSPSVFLANSTTPVESLYCFLSRVDPWPYDSNPPAPTQDQQYIKNVFKNMFVAKAITSNNITPVARRIDWTSGQVYDYYQDNVDMLAVDQNDFLIKSFYIKNRYDQVFKCLWNNNGAQATVEPFFQPGNYNTNNVFTGSDGYKWKYLYTIDIGSKIKFMDSTWIPVPLGQNTPNPLSSTPGIGSIDVVNVTNGGSGYDPANSFITVTITGDGSGASANAVVSNGQITDIIVGTPGTNYSYANVTIQTANSLIGSGATAIAPASPIGGHGFDPVSELGCNHVMFSVEFNGPESLLGVNYVPTDIDYRQIGILINPMDEYTYPYFANNSIYDLTTHFTVASGFGVYTSDETVVQVDVNSSSPTFGQTVFSATVLSFNTSTNVLYLINTSGTPLIGSTVTGLSSKTSRTLLVSTPPTIVPFSGYIAYIENRSGVQRSLDGIEQFKFVLGY